MTATPDYDTERCKRLSEEEWTDPAVVSSWDKWHAHFDHFSRGFTEEMLRVGDVKKGMHVLDLASGSGEPAITLARTVAPDGEVTAK